MIMQKERIAYRKLWVPMFLALVLFFSMNCKKDTINWHKVDPEFKMDFERNKYPPDSVLSGIALTNAPIAGDQKDKLQKGGVRVVSEAGNIATIQFRIRSLPFLTSQPFIIRISKPGKQKPIAKPN
jgi:hypothetical protein